MLKWFAAVAALLIVAGCDQPRMSASCVTPAATTTVATTTARPVQRSVGPCYDGTDRTDRTNRDDTTDRTVWCVEPAMMITAPTFMVFFDFDKSDLTAAAQETIRKAAAAYRTKGGAQIKASGHTDRAGTEAYNMALSLRRANAVKDQLVRDGVAASDISAVALGEGQPMVPTADGVREAQNRRVEIVIR
jgi:outer membrane protein OmpA-like peptidoglycan-associated protein